MPGIVHKDRKGRVLTAREDQHLGSPSLMRLSRLAADFSRVFALPLETALDRVDTDEKNVKLALLDAQALTESRDFSRSDLDQVLIDRGLAK